MRIVHIAPVLIKGGGERVAVELANHAANRHEVILLVATPTDPELLQTRVHANVELRFMWSSNVGRFARYFRLLPWFWRNRRWLMDQDIVHCHLTFGSVVGTLVWLYRRAIGASRPAVVETYHAVGMAVPRGDRWLHAKLAQGREALALVAEDTYWRSYIKRQVGRSIEVIPNGVAIAGQDELTAEACRDYRNAAGIPANCRLVVGTVSMLRPDRKPWLLIACFAEVARLLGSEVHLLLAGAGPEAEHLAAMATQQGIAEQVHMPGLVKEPRLAYANIDLYVTCNVSGITGVAALEAVVAGCPVVALQLDPAYQRREEDWIWSSSDPVEVAHEVARLLCSDEDRKELAVRQAAHVARNFTIEAMAKSYYSLYEVARRNLAA